MWQNYLTKKMGKYEKLGLRTVGQAVSDWINWVRLYQFKNGSRLFWNLLKKKNESFEVKAAMFNSPVILRDNNSDLQIFKQVFFEKQYDLYDKELPDAKTILDAGANVGMASIYFALRFPTASIVSLEPEKSNFKQLEINTHAYSGIIVMNKALWCKDESLIISNPNELSAGFVVESAVNSGFQTFAGISVPSLMEERGWDSIDILKMDVEGAEKEIFSAAHLDWLYKVKVLIVETHDRFKPGTTKALFNAIAKHDYSAYFHHENIFIFFNREK